MSQSQAHTTCINQSILRVVKFMVIDKCEEKFRFGDTQKISSTSPLSRHLGRTRLASIKI